MTISSVFQFFEGTQKPDGNPPADNYYIFTFDGDLITRDSAGTEVVISNILTVSSEIQLTASGASLPTTNPALRDTVETTTHAVLVPVLNFDDTTDEYAQWAFNLPSDYNNGTVTAQFVWTATDGTAGAAETVTWAIQAVALSNDDAIDTAFGTAQTVSDTWIADEDTHITSATSAITIGNTPTSGDLVVFRVFRDVSADDLVGDAQLINVIVTYTRG